MTWTSATLSGYTNFVTIAQTYLESDFAAQLPEEPYGSIKRQHKLVEPGATFHRHPRMVVELTRVMLLDWLRATDAIRRTKT